MHASKTAEQVKSQTGPPLIQGKVPQGTPRLGNTVRAVGARSRPEMNQSRSPGTEKPITQSRGEKRPSLDPGIGCPDMWGPATHIRGCENKQLAGPDPG